MKMSDEAHATHRLDVVPVNKHNEAQTMLRDIGVKLVDLCRVET